MRTRRTHAAQLVAIATLSLTAAACDRQSERAPAANTTEVSTSDEGSISDAMVTNIGVSQAEGNALEPANAAAEAEAK